MAKCPERGPLAQHVMGPAAEPELGLKAAVGEGRRRAPGDTAGLSVVSMKRFNQPHCPAACYAAAGPVLKASAALAAPVSRCALPSHPTAPSGASPPPRPHPLAARRAAPAAGRERRRWPALARPWGLPLGTVH